MEIPGRAAEDQAIPGQLSRPLRPQQKGDILPGLKQPSAKVPAQRTRADHKKTHKTASNKDQAPKTLAQKGRRITPGLGPAQPRLDSLI